MNPISSGEREYTLAYTTEVGTFTINVSPSMPSVPLPLHTISKRFNHRRRRRTATPSISGSSGKSAAVLFYDEFSNTFSYLDYELLHLQESIISPVFGMNSLIYYPSNPYHPLNSSCVPLELLKLHAAQDDINYSMLFNYFNSADVRLLSNDIIVKTGAGLVSEFYLSISSDPILRNFINSLGVVERNKLLVSLFNSFIFIGSGYSCTLNNQQRLITAINNAVRSGDLVIGVLESYNNSVVRPVGHGVVCVNLHEVAGICIFAFLWGYLDFQLVGIGKCFALVVRLRLFHCWCSCIGSDVG